MTDAQAALLVRKAMPELVRIRHYLHQHPEFRHREFGTAALVERELGDLGIEVRRIGATGVVGLLRGGRKGRTIGLRADMDALELVERTRLPYASTNGYMHACGHDGNTTVLLGVARVLAAGRKSLAGNVKLIFQPAEEGGGAGGKMMCDAGVLERPKVDAVFALHAFSECPVGGIMASPGTVQVSSDQLRLSVIGRGGHAAAPHRTVDPIVIAAGIVEGLQTIVSREQSPLSSAVVTIAAVQGGSLNSPNIIPDRVEMLGTARTLTAEQRREVFSAVRRIATGTARARGGRCVVRIVEGYPPTVNDAGMAELVRRVGVRLLGKKNVHVQPLSMGGEDFSFFLQRVRGCYFRLGTLPRACRTPLTHHSSLFDFNDDAIPVGVRMMTGIVGEFLKHGPHG